MSDPLTLSPDMDSFDRALAANPRAVVVGNLFGYPVDWRSIRARCGKEGPVLNRRRGPGIGERLRGKGRGYLRRFDGSELQPRQGLDRWRRRGLVVQRGAGGPRRVESGGGRRAKGRRQLLRTASIGTARSVCHSQRIARGFSWGKPTFSPRFPAHGIGSFSAGLAALTEGRALAEVETRKTNAKRLLSILEEGAWREVLRPPSPVSEGEASYLRLPVVLEAPLLARPLHGELSRWGVAGSYPLALPDLPEGKEFSVPSGERFPGAEILASRLLTFPTHSLLEKVDIEAYAGLIKCFAPK